MGVCLNGHTGDGHSVVALGMFDGVHLGHRVLLKRAKALAKQQGVELVVSTFSTHPMELIRPEQCPPMLTTLEERAERMRALGVDVLEEKPFDRAVMDTPPEEFIAGLCKRFHPLFIVVGYNHTFGRRGEGDPRLLAALGEVFGYRAEVVPRITLEGREVSSTVIRELLARGEVDLARQMMEQPYQRLALVTGRQGEVAALQATEDGKQGVAPGLYRALFQAQGRTWPGVLRAENQGVARAWLPGEIAPQSQVMVQYLHGRKSPGE
ncbi:MAG: FAD synthetase family protein [Candidatus Limiplasma sp.]|nr:FAD synthetase family protein [Candidatus Limiplasma sp.]